MTEIEKAERMRGSRALVMAMAAAILPLNAWLQYGDPRYSAPGLRGASWILLIGLWAFILWNGGGLRPRGRLRALLNDELSLQNRSRAVETGFYAAIVAALILYVAGWRSPIATGDALKIVSSAALSAALLRYAWLEWRGQ
jgi:hypothetical protein